MEGGATVASNQTSSLKHMTRKLVTTWNASTTPLRSGANTRQLLDFNVLQLKHNAQPNQAKIVK
jgi:hypothetical protein